MESKGIRWLLVPVDFSEASYVAARGAARIASRLDASLHLVHATDGAGSPEVFGGATSGTWWRGNESMEGIALAKKELAELAGAFEELGSKTTYEVVAGKPLSAIRDAIRHGRGDLIVLGVHSQHHWWHLFSDTTSDRAIRVFRRPVIAVKEGWRVPAPIRKMVVLTDFSDPSEAALDFAIHLARPMEARLDLVHALALHSAPFFPYDAKPSTDWCEGAAEVARGALGQGLARVHESGLHGQAHLAECGPVEAIELEAVRSADLVVVGTRSRGGWKGSLNRMILGSVAQGILRYARRSVAVVH